MADIGGALGFEVMEVGSGRGRRVGFEERSVVGFRSGGGDGFKLGFRRNGHYFCIWT